MFGIDNMITPIKTGPSDDMFVERVLLPASFCLHLAWPGCINTRRESLYPLSTGLKRCLLTRVLSTARPHRVPACCQGRDWVEGGSCGKPLFVGVATPQSGAAADPPPLLPPLNTTASTVLCFTAPLSLIWFNFLFLTDRAIHRLAFLTNVEKYECHR